MGDLIINSIPKVRMAGRVEIIAPGSSSKVSDVQQAIQNMQALGYRDSI